MKYKITLIFLMAILLVLAGCSSLVTSKAALAQCLTDKGAVMYGTEWCPHCQNQKAMFGDDFQYINYVDCEQNQEACQAAGIQGFPTWSIDGKLYPGEQKLPQLASLAGC